MRRYPPLDPPEYVDWTPEPALVAAYEAHARADPDRRAVIEALDEPALLSLYEGMVRARLHDITLKRWVRRGVISKAWLGTGEEAVTVGSVHALDRGRDLVAPMIRNAAACHEMGMSVAAMLRGYLGTADGPNGGRDLHIGRIDRGVLQPISHVGEMVPVITGAAMAFRARGEPRVALTWVGDGSTKTAAFHEGVNLAGVRRVPAVFIIQNNQVALGTRLDQHHAGEFRAYPTMYGIAGAAADGNHVLDVYAATRLAVERARAGEGPVLLSVDTFRMGGHATHDEAEARATFPAELFEHWGRRDPVGLFESYLVRHGIGRDRLEAVEASVTREVEDAAERALASRDAAVPRPEDAEYAGISAGARRAGWGWRVGG